MQPSWSHKLKRDSSEKTTWCHLACQVSMSPLQTQPSMVETSVPAVHNLMDTLGEEAPRLVVEPIFYSSFDIIIVGKESSLQSFLEWNEDLSLVFADKSQTLDHLEDNIRRVIADIRPEMLEKVIENWTSRLDYIQASRGSPMPGIIFKM
ncbi:hypothetical protein TNCV_2167961 [Trichonephila clavipes]|nr:hypothetical protein TNCV_2167961 [Trichonephila clavipes]